MGIRGAMPVKQAASLPWYRNEPEKKRTEPNCVQNSDVLIIWRPQKPAAPARRQPSRRFHEINFHAARRRDALRMPLSLVKRGRLVDLFGQFAARRLSANCAAGSRATWALNSLANKKV